MTTAAPVECKKNNNKQTKISRFIKSAYATNKTDDPKMEFTTENVLNSPITFLKCL